MDQSIQVLIEGIDTHLAQVSRRALPRPSVVIVASERDELVDRQLSGADERPQEPAVELTMLGNGKRGHRARAGHHDVASLPARHAPSCPLELANGLGSRNDGKRRHPRASDCYFHNLEAGSLGLSATPLLYLEPAFDRLTDVRDCLLTRPSLARAAWKCRALGYEEPVLAGIDEDLHGHRDHRSRVTGARKRRLYNLELVEERPW